MSGARADKLLAQEEVWIRKGVEARRTRSQSRIGRLEALRADRAARRVSRILSKEPDGTVLRISVAGGGCSGFQYEYNLVQEKPATDDIVLQKGDAVVLIDSMSLEFMGGSEIDFVDDLIGQAFQIRNPNAVASCGCGTSFAV